MLGSISVHTTASSVAGTHAFVLRQVCVDQWEWSMICHSQSNRGPLKKEKKEELKCGSLPTADIVGAVGKKVK